MNKIWMLLIIISILFSFFNQTYTNVNGVILSVAENTFELVIPLVLLASFWNGLLLIAKESGLLSCIEKLIHPLLYLILPDLKKDKESLSYIATNLIANLFGLGSVATMSGLKAMESMQKQNNHKFIASRSMVTFLVLNTGCITLFPTTIIALRHMYKSNKINEFVVPSILATVFSCICGLLLDRLVNYHEH